MLWLLQTRMTTTSSLSDIVRGLTMSGGGGTRCVRTGVVRWGGRYSGVVNRLSGERWERTDAG